MRAVCGAARAVTVARELTKRFEEIATFALGEASAWLAGGAHREQGEFVLILRAPPERETCGLSETAETWLAALVETVSVRDAARLVAKVTGEPRDALYARALQLRGERAPD